MKSIVPAVVYIIALPFFWGCGQQNTGEQTGEQLAKTHCASCHIFPEPALLDKLTWQTKVLPAMGKNFGIEFLNGAFYPVISHGAQGQASVGIAFNDWVKIVDYYKANAPKELPAQNRPPVTKFTEQFTAKEVLIDKGFPYVSFVKIDGGNKRLYAANATDSSLVVYDAALHKLSSQNIHGVLVDMNFEEDVNLPGLRKGAYTNIGYINPNDGRTGSAGNYSITPEGKFVPGAGIATALPRPVQVTPCDLDKDGKTDYLVCGFGNKAGEFYWMKNKGDGSFEKKLLWAIPGAIKAYVKDYNKDGLPDLMVLFAQAEEGIYLYINKGNGEFVKKDLLRFPPVYGSCYFELDDFNHDGFEDILYCSGDNADYSAKELKPYHGVYIYLNDGNYNFTQSYFFPIHGCYKAIARDFDKDGDLDIAAISFFPDRANQPQESFVYLENKGRFLYEPYTIPTYNSGNWLTLDAGDLDGDGFDDVVIGGLDMGSVSANSNVSHKNKVALQVLYNLGASKKGN